MYVCVVKLCFVFCVYFLDKPVLVFEGFYIEQLILTSIYFFLHFVVLLNPFKIHH